TRWWWELALRTVQPRASMGIKLTLALVTAGQPMSSHVRDKCGANRPISRPLTARLVIVLDTASTCREIPSSSRPPLKIAQLQESMGTWETIVLQTVERP